MLSQRNQCKKTACGLFIGQQVKKVHSDLGLGALWSFRFQVWKLWFSGSLPLGVGGGVDII